VWKQIEGLRRDGYRIESGHARGYRLISRPEALTEFAVQAVLSTAWLGRHLVCVPATTSTNTDAAALGRSGASHGTVVIADAQTAGRGRLGRSWVSTQGVNLYMSCLLRPTIVPAVAPQLSLVAGLAVARALEAHGLSPRIKWPNDVLLQGRKVCGILTEIEAETDRVSFVVVGIGVNLNSTLDHFPLDLHEIATSVFLASGSMLDRARFAANLLADLERAYETFASDGLAPLVPEWNRRASMIGSRVTVSGAGAEVVGTCEGIDADGALLLNDDAGSGRRRVVAGDVTVIGGYP